jgi:hypothetical protein
LLSHDVQMRPRPIDIDQPMEVLEEDSEMGEEFDLIEEHEEASPVVRSIEIPKVGKCRRECCYFFVFLCLVFVRSLC